MENKIAFNAYVDDHEHDGDTDNEAVRWKNLGGKILRIAYDADDDPDFCDDPRDFQPFVRVEFDFERISPENIIAKAKSRMQDAKRTGWYGECPTEHEVSRILSVADRKLGTNYMTTYAKQLAELQVLR